MSDEVLTIPEAARITKLGKSTIYHLTHSGALPAIRVGRAVRIRRETLERWLAQHEWGAIDGGDGSK